LSFCPDHKIKRQQKYRRLNGIPDIACQLQIKSLKKTASLRLQRVLPLCFGKSSNLLLFQAEGMAGCMVIQAMPRK
jgi:hypothetical protein